ncbi:MAG: phage tail protein [Serratia symbiotica]|nr:phage tail protein [Serratia symbiotica]
MAIETFSFPARVNTAGDTRYRIRKVQFGDGYTQVAGDGINPVIRSWELNFTGPREFIESVTRFLDVHQGVKSFQWHPPSGVVGLYRCEGYKFNAMKRGWFSVTATFIEAFHI